MTSPYRRLQTRAKQAGISANQKAAVLEGLLDGAKGRSGSRTPTPEPVSSQLHEPPVISAADGSEPITAPHFGELPWPDGFAGISKNGLFKTLPGWVDASQPPGTTSQVTSSPKTRVTRNFLQFDCTICNPPLRRPPPRSEEAGMPYRPPWCGKAITR